MAAAGVLRPAMSSLQHNLRPARHVIRFSNHRLLLDVLSCPNHIFWSAHQRLLGIVPYRLDNAETSSAALSEQKSVSRGNVFWTLDKAKGNVGAIARANQLAVNVDDSACLRYGTDMQHGLIALLDGGCVRQDKNCHVG